MPTTLRNTDILFNDGTTQSTAAGAPSSATAIGSVMYAANGTTSSIQVGTSVAGSSLFYPATVVTFSQGNTAAIYSTSGSAFNMTSLRASNTGTGNPGFGLPGASTLPGTWRSITPAAVRVYSYDGNYNQYGSFASINLWVRIA